MRFVIEYFYKLKVFAFCNKASSLISSIRFSNCPVLREVLVGRQCFLSKEVTENKVFEISHCKDLKEIYINEFSFSNFTHCEFSCKHYEGSVRVRSS